LNTRQLWDYLSLTPGVREAGGGSSTRRFAGSRANQSDASIDRHPRQQGTDGPRSARSSPTSRASQEFRVDMANNTAEYGAIGQVTVVSKSGTNQFHGQHLRLLLDAAVPRSATLLADANLRHPHVPGCVDRRPGPRARP